MGKKHCESSEPTPEYRAWMQMRRRCRDPRRANYGARGIKVCERWGDYRNFLADMGRKPSPEHSIDRIDSAGNYEPSNCRWATKLEQANNQSNNVFLEYDGKSLTLSQWSRIVGIRVGTLQQRRYMGWSADKILSAPVRKWPSQVTA